MTAGSGTSGAAEVSRGVIVAGSDGVESTRTVAAAAALVLRALRCTEPRPLVSAVATGLVVSAAMARPATAGAAVAPASDWILCIVAADSVGVTSGTLGGKRTSPSLNGKLNHLPKFAMVLKALKIPEGSKNGGTYPYSDPSPCVIGNARYQSGESRAPTTFSATRPTDVKGSSPLLTVALEAARAVVATGESTAGLVGGSLVGVEVVELADLAGPPAILDAVEDGVPVAQVTGQKSQRSGDSVNIQRSTGGAQSGEVTRAIGSSIGASKRPTMGTMKLQRSVSGTEVFPPVELLLSPSTLGLIMP